MERALLVTRESRGNSPLVSHLQGFPWQLDVCTQPEQARQAGGYDLIVIDSPLDTGRGVGLALSLAEHSTASVLLLIGGELLRQHGEEWAAAGLLVVEKPVVRVLLDQAIRFALVSRHRLVRLEKENLRLQDRLSQLQLVTRAKLVLMRDLSMSEEQAHKYIEQQAMNRRLPRGKIAENILRTYEHK